MSTKYCKMILSVAMMGIVPHLSQGDWAGFQKDWLTQDSWKKWGKQNAEALVNLFSDEDVSKTENTKENDELEQPIVGLNEKKEFVNETTKSKENFYDTLGIKYFPEQYLVGSEITLKKYLNTLLKDKKNRQAVAYFISLERKNHAAAISILESIDPAHRLVILLESPAKFVAKILVQMRNVDFKGKTLSHWGPYELQSEYFGRKDVHNAEIKGESVSLRYIDFIIKHETKSKKEFFDRAFSLANILSHVGGTDLASLLVYSHEEVLVKMGKKHESCFGAVKSKGFCDEETAIYLPEDFVGQLLNFMHNRSMISKQDIVNVLEAEFKINRNRFDAILKGINIKVIQDIALNFPEEIIACLPDEVILGAMPSYENQDSSLKIGDGKNDKHIIMPITTDNHTKIVGDEQEL